MRHVAKEILFVCFATSVTKCGVCCNFLHLGAPTSRSTEKYRWSYFIKKPSKWDSKGFTAHQEMLDILHVDLLKEIVVFAHHQTE